MVDVEGDIIAYKFDRLVGRSVLHNLSKVSYFMFVKSNGIPRETINQEKVWRSKSRMVRDIKRIQSILTKVDVHCRFFNFK